MTDVQTVEERLRTLMLDSLAGDEASYRLLLTEAGDRLRSFFGRRLGRDHAATEDLVQDTLIAIHTRRSTYDPERPFTAWLHAIARYKMIDALRRSHAHLHVPLDEAEPAFAPDAAADATAAFDVERLLGTLPAGPRELVRGVKLEGRSIAEMSDASGLSPSAVKVAVHRALKLLSRRLGPS